MLQGIELQPLITYGGTKRGDSAIFKPSGLLARTSARSVRGWGLSENRHPRIANVLALATTIFVEFDI